MTFQTNAHGSHGPQVGLMVRDERSKRFTVWRKRCDASL